MAEPKPDELAYWMGQVDGRLNEMQTGVNGLNGKFHQLVMTREGWRDAIESRLSADAIRFEEHSQRLKSLETNQLNSEKRMEQKLAELKTEMKESIEELQSAILAKITETGDRRPTWQWLVEKIAMPIGVGLISAVITASVMLSLLGGKTP